MESACRFKIIIREICGLVPHSRQAKTSSWARRQHPEEKWAVKQSHWTVPDSWEVSCEAVTLDSTWQLNSRDVSTWGRMKVKVCRMLHCFNDWWLSVQRVAITKTCVGMLTFNLRMKKLKDQCQCQHDAKLHSAITRNVFNGLHAHITVGTWAALLSSQKQTPLRMGCSQSGQGEI